MKFSNSHQAALLLAWLLSTMIQIHPGQAALTTENLLANNLNFTCTVLNHTAGDSADVKNIMLLHGFPMFRVWWLPLLSMWDELLTTRSSNITVHAVACDLRGYSPGASPDNVEDYDYPIFASDTFALAEAAGFDDGFDLLGHDHGAALAWYVAANDPNGLVKSLTSLSVPHIGLMSDALCGENVDEDQVTASNYFNQFSLVDSATVNNASLTQMFQAYGFGDSLDPESFQKMLWWYNGSLAKTFSMPRILSDEEVAAYEEKVGEAASFVMGTRQAIPMEERECIPASEDVVGTISVPTLFICGLSDSALLCNNSYVTDYPPDLLPDYEHANYQCGHDFFLEGNCASMEETQKVMDKITMFVLPDLVSDGSGSDTVSADVETDGAADGEAVNATGGSPDAGGSETDGAADGAADNSTGESPEADGTSDPASSATKSVIHSAVVMVTGLVVFVSTLHR